MPHTLAAQAASCTVLSCPRPRSGALQAASRAFAFLGSLSQVSDVLLVQNATETDNICASTCDNNEDCT